MNFSRILLINPFGIGDVLFTTPVIGNLRLHNPQARIGYLANRRTADFLRGNPKIDRVFVYERDEFVKDLAGQWKQLYHEVRQERFEAALDFSMNSNFGFFCQMAGIPVRLGYDFRGRGRFLTRKWPLSGYEGRHVVEYYLDLLRKIGLPAQVLPLEMPVRGEDTQWALQWLKNQGIGQERLKIAVVPGGGASWGSQAQNKRWPPEKYAHLVDKMIADLKAVVILMGDIKEEPLCQEVARLAHYPVHSAAGQTSLMQMAALMKFCGLVIANDGGPLHVAAAAGAATVGIFGPVDEAVYGAWPPQGQATAAAKIACRPCYRNFRMTDCRHISCLQVLSVEDVYQKVHRKAQSKS